MALRRNLWRGPDFGVSGRSDRLASCRPVQRKRGNRKIECSGCSRKFSEIYDIGERAVRDLPWSEFRTTVFIEVYRVKCPDCDRKREKVLLLPSKAPFSKRFEDAVELACEGAPARRVARQFGLAESTRTGDRSAVSGTIGSSCGMAPKGAQTRLRTRGQVRMDARCATPTLPTRSGFSRTTGCSAFCLIEGTQHRLHVLSWNVGLHPV